MNYYHKRKLKRKIRRQIQGIRFHRRRDRFKTILYKWPNLGLGAEIVGVQPMSGPVGTVFHLNYIYESLRN